VFEIRPDIGAMTLAQVYCLYSIVSGLSTLVITVDMPNTGNIPDLAHRSAR
jgi:hypothetical protein